MKKLYIFTLLATVFIFSRGLFVHAEGTESASLKKFNVTFPIAELGNCTSLSACHDYCEIKENHDACVAYAKQKGFFHEPNEKAIENSTLQSARSELGCNSAITCRALCELPENHDKCETFGRKNHLLPSISPTPSPNPELLIKAKEILGCDSFEACKTFCRQPEHHDTCESFGKSLRNKSSISPEPSDFPKDRNEHEKREDRTLSPRPSRVEPSQVEPSHAETEETRITPEVEPTSTEHEDVKGASTNISPFTNIIHFLFGGK